MKRNAGSVRRLRASTARYEEMGCVDEDFLDDPLTRTKPCTCRFHHTKECPRNNNRLPLPCWRRKYYTRKD